MTDVIDAAQTAEANFLQGALAARAELDSGNGPEMIDGIACCVDCERPIPLSRLEAVPNASRCVKCQEEAELAA